MEQHRPKTRRRRMVLAALALVLLYVLSSGPLQFSQTVFAGEPKFADDGDVRRSDGSSANHLPLNLNILGEDGRPLWARTDAAFKWTSARWSHVAPGGQGSTCRWSGCPDTPRRRGSAIIGACFRFESPDEAAA